LDVVAKEVRQATHVLHVTLGVSKRKAAVEEVRQRLREVDARSTSPRISQLHYATYDAGLRLGPLETPYVVTLESA
jgi:hypothetical protein